MFANSLREIFSKNNIKGVFCSDYEITKDGYIPTEFALNRLLVCYITDASFNELEDFITNHNATCSYVLPLVKISETDKYANQLMTLFNRNDQLMTEMVKCEK